MSVRTEVYLDESGTHAGAPTICVAGYVVDRSQSAPMAEDWHSVLAEFELPYFHNVDCVHGNGVFSNLSKQQRIQVAARMIGIIKRRTIMAIGVTLDLNAFNSRFGQSCLWGSPYTLAMHHVWRGVGHFADLGRYQGDIAYFFESGHQSQLEANELMRIALRAPEIKRALRYASHEFVAKVASPQVQAADILAWHLCKDAKSVAEGRPRRKDTESLFAHHSVTANIGDVDYVKYEKLFEKQRKALARRGINISPDVQTNLAWTHVKSD